MVLPIVKYGHPALRQKGAPLESITPDIQALIDDMLETMHQAAGIGLAAQQVGKALQLTVIDVRDITDRPSTLEVDGQPTEVQSAMPLILINPKIQPTGNPSTGPEGCLSFPEIYADITRPEAVTVSASNRNGEPLRLKADGLLSRVIQHEVDHLNGILFIDRMSSAVKSELKPQLEELRQATQAALQGKTN
jgi:peptide deformylase